MSTQPNPSIKNRKKGPKLTKDGKITVFDIEDTSYGIRELIDLIRYIPDGQDVFFGAEMIKKTLMSMQISIHDIMQDGVEKRKLAAKTIQHLIAEISDYQRRIQSLKGHIRHLRYELGEIQDTCHYLITDDVELGQYQHILEPVPKSPIEDSSEDFIEADLDETLNRTSKDLNIKNIPTLEPGESTPPSRTSPLSEEHALEPPQECQTLTEEDLVFGESDDIGMANNQEAFKVESETNEPQYNQLTDEVFNPDRFDDNNGMNHAESDDNIDEKKFAEENTPTSKLDDFDEFAKRL